MCGANKALRTIVLLCFKLFPVFQSSGKVYIFRITLVYKDSNFLYTLMIQCGCYRILETYIINIFWVYRGIFFSHSGLFIYDPPNLRLTLWHIVLPICIFEHQIASLINFSKRSWFHCRNESYTKHFSPLSSGYMKVILIVSCIFSH